MPHTWQRALDAYRYPVDLNDFEDAKKCPDWFGIKLSKGDRDETMRFEAHFREQAPIAIEPWCEVVFWKLYTMPLARQKTTRQTIERFHQRKTSPSQLWESCLEYVTAPSRRTFEAFRLLFGFTGRGIAVAATFPAFIAPDGYPMTDRRIAEWVKCCIEEHNASGADAPKLALPRSAVSEGELLSMDDFEFMMSWAKWCRHIAAILSARTSFKWRARDVEMAVFQAWGRNRKNKSGPDTHLSVLAASPA